jgi:hypothetical protein
MTSSVLSRTFTVLSRKQGLNACLVLSGGWAFAKENVFGYWLHVFKGNENYVKRSPAKAQPCGSL